MKLIKSPLVLVDFVVIQCQYKYQDPGEADVNVMDIFNSYDLDFDYGLKENKDETVIFTKIGINNVVNPAPGYVLFVESASIFKFTGELSDTEKKSMLAVSGLSIAINNLRTYISTISSFYPLGKYHLPSIDLNEILAENKKKSEQKKKGLREKK